MEQDAKFLSEHKIMDYSLLMVVEKIVKKENLSNYTNVTKEIPTESINADTVED